METLKLSKPIMINGEEVTELPYDFENLTAKDKLNASKKMKAAGIPLSIPETDPDYHLYLFAEAVCKVNSAIDITDIMRMSAKDADKAASLARSFFYLDLAE
ncbi:phage tail assembly protein [Biomaibacter acetigenes]|uniref:Phage tail assembly protein n=1 Tax=Biomaibacter acetigenes TaxID=2316383 RepID=A0A3G2R4I0_9FIRM|nr:phage tail assembly protein [Biomaibacter acetigenes]AYO30255.1 phage tail assembly protein [Biomaibacter acetigenes]